MGSRTKDRGYLRNRERVRRTEDTCAWCGAFIDPDLKYPDPMSFSADHIVPVSRGGANRGALQAAHLQCNKQRGARLNSQRVTPHARQW